ncbi:hypothetical protein FQR65_LT20850 [Abscondita terminalis]|nr:hypothetical protein FQR65_LT20850 [Abscondita terminalis]
MDQLLVGSALWLAPREISREPRRRLPSALMSSRLTVLHASAARLLALFAQGRERSAPSSTWAARCAPKRWWRAGPAAARQLFQPPNGPTEATVSAKSGRAAVPVRRYRRGPLSPPAPPPTLLGVGARRGEGRRAVPSLVPVSGGYLGRRGADGREIPSLNPWASGRTHAPCTARGDLAAASTSMARSTAWAGLTNQGPRIRGFRVELGERSPCWRGPARRGHHGGGCCSP